MSNLTESNKASHSVFAAEIDGYSSFFKLSRRETEVVVALIRNITNSEEIAKTLTISTHTVNNHLKSIFEKTKTSSKTEILATFLRYAAECLQRRSPFVRRPSLLIVSEETVLSSFIANGLRDRGIKAYTLTDPGQITEMLRKFAIDFVVFDASCNNARALDYVKQIRSAFPNWPQFVLLNAEADCSTEDCMQVGAVGYLTKPLDMDQLFRTVMGHLIEPIEEKARYLRLDLSSVITLPKPCQIGVHDLGFGGAFIPLDGSIQKKYRLNVGCIVEANISPLQASVSFKVKGRIAWKRSPEDSAEQPGIGLQFIEVSDHDQFLLDEWLKTHEEKAFIPNGRRDVERGAEQLNLLARGDHTPVVSHQDTL